MEKTPLVLAALLTAVAVPDVRGGGGAMADPESELLIERLQNESSGNLSALIEEAEGNRAKVDEALRAEIAGEIAKAALGSDDQVERENATRYLMDEVHSSDSTAAKEFALRTLLGFRAADFSDAERQRIADQIHMMPPSPLYSRLAGVAQAERAVPILQQFTDSANFGSLDPCLLYTSPSPRDRTRSRMPSSA